MVNEVRDLISGNDQKLKIREEKLTLEIDTIYEQAVKKAMNEFRKLEKLDTSTKLNSKEVKLIFAKALVEFQKSFKVLSEPIKEAMEDSYKEGLRETGKILEMRERK